MKTKKMASKLKKNLQAGSYRETPVDEKRAGEGRYSERGTGEYAAFEKKK